jgi:hypothetical protein
MHFQKRHANVSQFSDYALIVQYEIRQGLYQLAWNHKLKHFPLFYPTQKILIALV